MFLLTVTGCAPQAEPAQSQQHSTPTTRLSECESRAARYESAKSAYEQALIQLRQLDRDQRGQVERACDWSVRWRDAAQDGVKDQAKRLEIERDHLERVRGIHAETMMQRRAQDFTRADIAAARYYVSDAELRVATSTR
jgi:hypothetical protein